MSVGRGETSVLVWRHSSINWYQPIRMHHFPRLTNQRRVSSSILIGARQVLSVGGNHSPINHSTSCLQIRPGPAGDKVISLICSFIHFCAACVASNFLKIDLETRTSREIEMGFIGFQIDIPTMWISGKVQTNIGFRFNRSCSKLILKDASPRRRSEKAREETECRRVR